MTGTIAGFAALIAMPLFGVWTWRWRAVRELDLPTRAVIAAAAGAVTLSVGMTLMSLTSIRWSRVSLLVLAAVVVIVSVLTVRSREPVATRRRFRITGSDAGTLLFVIAMAYGAASVRISSGDLHYFWGPKAIHFAAAGEIATAFLANPDYRPLHPDYPPMLPLIYAWSQIIAGRFAWMAAVMLTPVLVGSAALVLRGLSGRPEAGLMLAAPLAYCGAVGWVAGGADVALVFFEVTALAAMTFIRDSGARVAVAAIGVAGAVWLKVEGTSFAIAMLAAALVTSMRVRDMVRILAPAAVLLVSWLLFTSTNGLRDAYRLDAPLYIESIPTVLWRLASVARYDAWWLPWIAPAAIIAVHGVRRARFPLVVMALTLAATVFYYSHSPDPGFWIASSAQRVLLTPLVALIVGSVAAMGRQVDSAAVEEDAAVSSVSDRAAVAFAAIVILSIDYGLLRFLVERGATRAAMRRNADAVAGINPFLDEVRRRTARGDTVAVVAGTRDRLEYEYVFARATYVLAGRTVVRTRSRDGRALPDPLSRAKYLAVFEMPYTGEGTVVWRGKRGALIRTP